MLRLLVEGMADKHFLRYLLENQGILLNENFEIQECGGVESLLRESLPTHLLGSYDAIGVVVDADLNLRARWESIRNRLLEREYDPPLEPAYDGVILTSRMPAIGVWLMPDNSLPGILEDFAKEMIPADDDLWPIAEARVASLPEPRRFADTMQRKAEIHTWLAWQSEPGTPLGLAVAKKYFRANTHLVHRFVNWVQLLRNVHR